MLLAEQLREQMPAVRVLWHCGGGSFKNQMKKADKSGAKVAIIIGEDELSAGQVQIKPLRGQGQTQAVSTVAANGAVQALIQ